MRFTLPHPKHPNQQAEYGWDPVLGFFVTHFEDGYPAAEYDRMHDGYTHLDGALRFLARHGYYSVRDLERALVLSTHTSFEDLPKRLRTPGEVQWNFKVAAD